MTRTRRNWTLATKENTRWKQFGTTRSMQESQNQVIYQVSTIWFHRKDIRKKKIPRSQLQQSNTLESSSACSTRTTLISQRRLLLQSIPHHRQLDQQSSQPSLSSGNEDDQQDALRSASRCANGRANRSNKEEVTRMNPSHFGFLKRPKVGRWPEMAQGASGSLHWQFDYCSLILVAGDLSPWHRE